MSSEDHRIEDGVRAFVGEFASGAPEDAADRLTDAGREQVVEDIAEWIAGSDPASN